MLPHRTLKKLFVFLALSLPMLSGGLNATVLAFTNTSSDLQSIIQNTPFYDPTQASACPNSSQAVQSTSLTGSDNIQKTYNFLLSKGLNNYQSAAVIGNLEQESGQGLNPLDQQNRSKSQVPIANVGFGIAQWTDPGRQQGLIQLAASEGLVPGDLSAQLDYLWQELNTTHSNALAALKSSTDVTSATVAFEQTYEGASDPVMATRISYAQSALALYGGLSASATATSPCGTQADANCASSTSGQGSGQVGQNVVCIAKAQLALWTSQPGYPNPAYSKTGYLDYSEGTPEEWCADFVSWVYNQAGYPLSPDPGWKQSYVPNIESIGQQNRNFHWHTQASGYIPQPGDIAIIIRNNTPSNSHTNIFINSSGGVSYFIGGDQGNGPYPGGSIVSQVSGSGYYNDGGDTVTGYVSSN